MQVQGNFLNILIFLVYKSSFSYEKFVIIFKLNKLKSIHLSYSGISGKKVNNTRFNFNVAIRRWCKKSTTFHAVCNVQLNCAGIPWNEKTIVKHRSQPKANRCEIVSQTVLEVNQKDPVNKTMNPNWCRPTQAWKPLYSLEWKARNGLLTEWSLQV